ncbi:MAG: hypothetical protein GY787_14725 [Alteromonadales bacterium]|nr:hypothetical protein [Alteromonadales bacterium]
MAINVDTVYKTVLLILNKEQRGYVTPDEFNKIATQVQLEIFEKYFEDLNQQMRIPENDSEYGNRVKNVDEKISIFKTIQSLAPSWVVGTNEFNIVQSPATITPTVHRIGTVIYKDEQELEKVDRNDWLRLNMSKLTRPTADYPMYLYQDNKIIIQPPSLVQVDPLNPLTILDQFSISYVRKPADVIWGYTVLTNGAYSFDSTSSQDFEIDDTDQTEVILRILIYMGIVIRDPQIVQAAAQQAGSEEQNQKS